MSEYLAGRAQMGTSLAFHIVFAALGVGLPLLLFIAEGLSLRPQGSAWRQLARRWARAFAILFAVGAVSGTVISFELGLLWPGFMRYAGSIIGLPFSLEGFAFFVEAIFLGLYLYGWERLSARAHWLTTVPLMISGAASAWFVVTANAWMNSPAGFKLQAGGKVTDIRPLAAMLNPATGIETAHTMLSCYLATGFAVAAVYAVGMLRGRRGPVYRSGLALGLLLGAICAPLQIITGDINARWVADHQPVKLAAMEGQFATESGAPLRIGGFPDPSAATTRFAIEIPSGLSWLAYGDTRAVVRGLGSFPAGDRPDPRPVHVGFQVMVGSGFYLLGVAAWFLLALWRPRLSGRWLFRAVAFGGILGFVAIEAGWMVTEIGRQPWVVYGIFRTAQAITPAPGLVYSFLASTAIYLALSAITIALLLRLTGLSRREEALHVEPEVAHN